MYPGRIVRELYNGTTLIANVLPNRDYTHGRYSITAEPGSGAAIVRTPFLTALAIDRMEALGVDVREIRATERANMDRQMNLLDADAKASARKEQTATRRGRKKRRA